VGICNNEKSTMTTFVYDIYSSETSLLDVTILLLVVV